MIDKKIIIIIVISILGIVVSCSLLMFNKQIITLGNVTNEYQYIAEINDRKIYIKYDNIFVNKTDIKELLKKDNNLIHRLIKKSTNAGMNYDGGTTFYKSKDINSKEYYIVTCYKTITEEKNRDIYITNDMYDDKLCTL